ncbi:TonB-dependent siderophore receptor [Sphingomonadaceae bacterium jetA1]|jgi:iron complex outermembrane receptor protein|uniref:TonB-dependent siderophore receptor n=1 Tax=Facivitalis istanbulensis TaxID=3075838 RepID=UPI003496BCEE
MPASGWAQAIERATVPTAPDADGADIVVQASRSTDGYRPADSYVATGISADVLDTPRSISMVSQQLLQDRGVVNLEQAIQTLPGVAQDNSFGGTQDSFNIRGFRVYSSTASTNPGILIDGVRGAMARGFQANTDRVELLAGPSAMLYGRTEPGGVINIVRKQPLYTPYHSVEADIGSYRQYRAVGDTSGPVAPLGDGELAYRLVVSGERQGYWRNVGHDMLDVLVAPSLGWRNDKLQAVLAYEYNDSTAPLDRGTILAYGVPVATPRKRSFAEDFSRYHNRSHFLRGNIDYEVEDWLTLRTRAAYMSYLSSDVQVNPYRLSANGNLLRYIFANRDDRQDNTYVQESAVATFDTGEIKHELLFGGDYRYQNRHQRGQDFSGVLSGFNIYNPVYDQISEADAEPQPSEGPFFINRSREWGVFGQDSLTLGRLTAVGGLRWAHITQFGSSRGEVTDDSRKGVFLPSASLLYRLTDHVTAYASYSTSYHPNASVPATPLTPATGPFAPEKGKGWEFGAKAEFIGGKLLTTAALFRIDKRNVLTTSNDVTSAVGSVRSQGVELTASGQLTPALNLTAAYTYLDATVRDDPTLSGNRFVNVPRNKGSVFGAYEIKAGALKGLAFGSGVTTSSRIAVDTANTAFLPGYATVDAVLRYRARIANGLIYRVQLNARNLLNRTYYPYSNGSYRIGVGEPRTVMVTGKIEF